jgi:hypothetical protein
MGDQCAEQNEDGKSDYKIGKVYHSKNLVVADVAENT